MTINPGVLVTGGYGAKESAEVILEDGSTCTLPDLPSPGRNSNSATGLTLCGGFDTDTSTCSIFSNGQWETSHLLGVPRYRHVSWDSPLGIIIIGGEDSEAQHTTETLSPNSNTTAPAFPLPYTTK